MKVKWKGEEEERKKENLQSLHRVKQVEPLTAVWPSGRYEKCINESAKIHFGVVMAISAITRRGLTGAKWRSNVTRRRKKKTKKKLDQMMLRYTMLSFLRTIYSAPCSLAVQRTFSLACCLFVRLTCPLQEDTTSINVAIYCTLHLTHVCIRFRIFNLLSSLSVTFIFFPSLFLSSWDKLSLRAALCSPFFLLNCKLTLHLPSITLTKRCTRLFLSACRSLSLSFPHYHVILTHRLLWNVRWVCISLLTRSPLTFLSLLSRFFFILLVLAFFCLHFASYTWKSFCLCNMQLSVAITSAHSSNKNLLLFQSFGLFTQNVAFTRKVIPFFFFLVHTAFTTNVTVHFLTRNSYKSSFHCNCYSCTCFVSLSFFLHPILLRLFHSASFFSLPLDPCSTFCSACLASSAFAFLSPPF